MFEESTLSPVGESENNMGPIEIGNASPLPIEVFCGPEFSEENARGGQFSWVNERRNVFVVVEAVAELMHKENIQNIIMLDRSARPLWIGLREYWKLKYPELPLPDMYFVNPLGFCCPGMDPKSLEDFRNKAVKREGIVIDRPIGSRTTQEIDDEFKKKYYHLVAQTAKPLLVFDTCIHQGHNIEPVISSLRRVGFNDIQVVTPDRADPDYNSPIKPDYVVSKTTGFRCYMFGCDKMVAKQSGSVVSQPSLNEADRVQACGNRKSIRTIIGVGLDYRLKQEAERLSGLQSSN
ncbi:MAG: hypothetical protein NTY61_02780 [Candidatus Parcubacteria bacterium]|nr:hypothetical protein [Candidatus Parcubacteria bacterium]